MQGSRDASLASFPRGRGRAWLPSPLPLFLALFLTLNFLFLLPGAGSIAPGIAILLLSILFLRKGKRELLSFLLGAGLSLFILLFLILPPWEGGQSLGVVVRAKDGYFLVQTGFTRLYVQEEGCLREIGDIVRLDGKAEPLVMTEYESRFSFREYLIERGVRGEFRGEAVPILSFPLRLREWAQGTLQRVGEEARPLLDSLLFDRKDYEALSLFEGAGLLYCLSASGLIFGTSLRFMDWCLALFLRERPRRIVGIILSIVPMLFLLHKAGVWRIFLVWNIRAICSLKGKRPPSGAIINPFIGIAFIALDPWLALDTGFRLSYLLALFMGFSKEIIDREPRKWRPLVSKAILLVLLFPTFPEGNELSLLAPFRTMLFLPFVLPFLGLGALGLFLPISSALDGYARFLMDFARLWERFDISVPCPFPDELFLGHYLLLGFLFLTYSIGLRRHSLVLGCASVLPFLFLALPLPRPFSSQVSFINVGQGDAILFREGETAVLIDTGGNVSVDIAKEVLIPFFRKEGVRDLDAVIITHGDMDHDGALPSLYDNFPIGEIVRETSQFPFEIGNFAFENLNDYGFSGENESSLVLFLGDFLGKDWLLMGDAPSEVEARIAEDHPELRADILKVGHHGSSTSSSLPFLLQVRPEEAIVSVGAGNRYGHPDEDVLGRLEEAGAVVRRTDLEGTITYRGWGTR